MKRILDHLGLKPDLSGLVKLFHLMRNFETLLLARVVGTDSDKFPVA